MPGDIALDALKASLRLDELYRTVDRSQGDARVTAMTEILAIRQQIRRVIEGIESDRSLLSRVARAMRDGWQDQADGLRDLARMGRD